MSLRLTRPDMSTSFETFCRSKEGSWYLTVNSAAAAARLVVSRSRPLMRPSALSSRSISGFGSAPCS
jgi:hypothetical protein